MHLEGWHEGGPVHNARSPHTQWLLSQCERMTQSGPRACGAPEGPPQGLQRAHLSRPQRGGGRALETALLAHLSPHALETTTHPRGAKWA